MSSEVIQRSMEGIQREINRRVARLETIKVCVTGDERRFIKPVKDQQRVITMGLQVYREIQQLRRIKKHMRVMV